MNNRAFFLACRVFLSSVFVGLGIERVILAVAGTSGGTGALAFAIFELVAGVMILVGWQVRWVALVMAAFLLVDAFLSHQFWRYAGAEQHGQLLHFLKNFTMIGGLMLLSWVEAGRRPSTASQST